MHWNKAPLMLIATCLLEAVTIIVTSSCGSHGNQRTPATKHRPTATPQVQEFPWPPTASTNMTIPNKMLLGGKGQIAIGDVADRLQSILNQAGYSQTGFYAIPGDGFALVSQMEQFNPDGSPVDPPFRFNTTELVRAPFVSLQYWKELLKGTVGRFRVIVFIVSNRPFAATGTQPSGKDGASLAKRGATSLPLLIRSKPYTNDFVCTALVYEFRKKYENQEAEFQLNSDLNADTHLRRAKIMAILEK